MNKFYLNNYKWLEPTLAIVFALTFCCSLHFLNEKAVETLIADVIDANKSLIGAVVSLLGFVFATITILIGLGDNYRSNDQKGYLVDVVIKLLAKREDELNSEEFAKVKNKHTASSLFFSSQAYSLTLKSLFGCVKILAVVFILSLIVSIIGKTTCYWATSIVLYQSFVLFTLVRMLILLSYLIMILTNQETSDK